MLERIRNMKLTRAIKPYSTTSGNLLTFTTSIARFPSISVSFSPGNEFSLRSFWLKGERREINHPSLPIPNSCSSLAEGHSFLISCSDERYSFHHPRWQISSLTRHFSTLFASSCISKDSL